MYLGCYTRAVSKQRAGMPAEPSTRADRTEAEQAAKRDASVLATPTNLGRGALFS